MAGHLLYWGKATVIYPVCENNVYIISPKISNVLTPTIKDRSVPHLPEKVQNFPSTKNLFDSYVGKNYLDPPRFLLSPAAAFENQNKNKTKAKKAKRR